MCDPTRRARFFEKQCSSNEIERSKELFQYVYDTYIVESGEDVSMYNQDSQSTSGHTTPSVSSHTSSFMATLYDDSDAESSTEKASEFDRYLIHREGADCGKQPEDVLEWWKVCAT